MRRERLLYILLGVLFVAYVVVEYYAPKPTDWTITFSDKDKNPYGGYILYDRMEDFFSEKSVSFQTLYESQDSTDNIIILAKRFKPSEADLGVLFQILSEGRSIMINAQSFSENFLDTLGIAMGFIPVGPFSDSVIIKFGKGKAHFPATFAASYFKADSLGNGWTVHASTKAPVLISRHFQGADLILSTMPLVFTNYGLLHKESRQVAAAALRLLPYKSIAYNRFYQTGKPEPTTPLRYLLSQASLRWAVYLTLLALMLYLVIGSRRVQRMIPLLDPNKNTTVQFIKTIGGLYHREGNHKNAAQKLINHFLKTLSDKYFIHSFNEKTYHSLAIKTGVTVEEVIETFSLIQSVRQSGQLSEDRLKELYERINKFKINKL